MDKQRPRHVAIVGSRDYPSYRYGIIQSLIDDLRGCVVVSGGGGNVDLKAEQYCNRLGIKTIIHRAEWGKHGKAAGPIRNSLIVSELQEGDEVHAFTVGPLNPNSGTADTVRKARAKGIKVVFHE